VPETHCELTVREHIRNKIGCNPYETLFIAVGNPRPEKGFEDLIDAVAFLRNDLSSDKGFLVAVAGSLNNNDYCQMLMRRVEDCQISKQIKFLGYCEDVTSLYRSADAFVLSSRSEGLPMVILEAMMSGLPVVATRIGGIPEAVGSQVLLVEPEQPRQLASAMKRLMEEDDLRERLGLSGRKHVKEFYGVDRMVNDYVRSYQGMLMSD
jgi:glycosyltransferase involved in cell wall biosynthesis